MKNKLQAMMVVLIICGSVFTWADEPLTIKQARVAVTGHDVNRPDPFPGAGDFGWAGNIEQLADGRLMLVHQWGYWHSSFGEPRLIEPELAKRWRAEGWPLDFKAPTGGRSMFTTSDDGGRTWSKPRTLIDLPQDDSPYGLLRLSDGTLLCFISVQASWYGYEKAPPQLADTLDGLNTQQCVIRSADGGKTWSKPVFLKSPGNFYERSHARPIVMPRGVILWPTYCLDSRTGHEFGVVHRSTDGGESWQVMSQIRRDGKAMDEPAITRLANGELLAVCRPDGAAFRSKDQGRTWKEEPGIVVSGTLKAPWLDVLSDGTVVCMVTIGRLYVFLSSDHGHTWTKRIPLDESCYGYPGGLRLADDSIVCSYVESGRAPSRIYVVRFRANEKRDGIELLKLGNP